MKKLYRHYITFGNGSGRELSRQGIIDDTLEARKELVNEIKSYYADSTYGTDKFIAGTTTRFEIEIHDDWDSPTGGTIILYTQEDILKEIKDKATKEINEINKLFEGE